MDDARNMLEKLRQERGDDYAALSRLLGRNLAYVQQFMRRGTPRRLAERDRQTLARYFGVDEVLLGGPPSAPATVSAIARIDVAASAGPGALVEDRRAGKLTLDPDLLRAIGARTEALSAIHVTGESMLPTLADGDEIVVNRDDAQDRLREGIYVLRLADGLVVKRLVFGPDAALIIRSDNPAWPDQPGTEIEAVIGRVVWVGRRLA